MIIARTARATTPKAGLQPTPKTDSLLPTSHSDPRPPVRSAELRRRHVDSAAALVEHIRYKVIIRISLSVRRFRDMVVRGRPSSARTKGQGSEICPGLRPSSWKYASAWRSPATCPPKSDRLGDAERQRWRHPCRRGDCCGRRRTSSIERSSRRSPPDALQPSMAALPLHRRLWIRSDTVDLRSRTRSADPPTAEARSARAWRLEIRIPTARIPAQRTLPVLRDEGWSRPDQRDAGAASLEGP